MRDPGVDAVIRQWTSEREQSAEDREITRIASAWLAEAPQTSQPAPGIPGQRRNTGAGSWAPVDAADPGYLAAMRERLPEVPDELLTAAAGWWQMIGDVSEAEAWWDAGISPLDQRALDYRAAGLAPADLSKRLGPLTVLEHLRRGSAPAWCVARLSRQRRDAAS
ncbi:transcriptional regulator [Prauserella sp. PE36]|uniref:Helix-turn-helix transcriptional regulator n=1 Tax=Prauserella endophytica TaxID=1592324 RepID=A0ABY2S268_9PSEU|nr:MULTISPECIES: helix-turn-helix transcriptional regulator [Prauserella]PXY33044.1 hypothetical protein BAY59_07955 [Prauserella coralliicola]RBM16401.1 transcriptional regulator [Prauserella sp. PE36]TKG69542.1 helix-turn-helix transcriptional regulator [Prauserella endophytica]